MSAVTRNCRPPTVPMNAAVTSNSRVTKMSPPNADRVGPSGTASLPTHCANVGAPTVSSPNRT